MHIYMTFKVFEIPETLNQHKFQLPALFSQLY